MIGPMAMPVAPTRKRGNPNWGRRIPVGLALATQFELQVSHLQLTGETYTSSVQLRAWCERNRNRCSVPEWLLKEWEIAVDPILAA
jgi:hypothetical protein